MGSENDAKSVEKELRNMLKNNFKSSIFEAPGEPRVPPKPELRENGKRFSISGPSESMILKKVEQTPLASLAP